MKKLLLTLGLFLLPAIVFASTTIPWQITNLTDTSIFPSLVNGGAKGVLVAASSTIGNGTQTGGLTVSGGATTTGTAYFPSNVGIGAQPSTGNLQVTGTTFLNGGIDVGDTAFYDNTVAFSVKSARTWIFNMYGATTNPLLFLNQNAHLSIKTITSGTKALLTVGDDNTVDNLATAQISIGAIGDKGLVLQGFSTGNIQEWQNSSAGVLSVVDKNGSLGVASSTPWKELSVGSTNTGTFAISTSTSGCAQFSSLGEIYSTGSACGTGSGSGGDPFTHVSVFGQTTSATGTLLSLTGSTVSLAASSTAWFDQINVGSTTSGTMATSTFAGAINVANLQLTNKMIFPASFNNALVGVTSGNVTTPVSAGPCSSGSFLTTVSGAGGSCSTFTATFPITYSSAVVGFSGLSTSSAISAASGLTYATGVNTIASVSTSSNSFLINFASTTVLSASGQIYDSALVSGNCVQASTNGQLTTTGSACGSGSGSDPFTHPVTTQSATTTTLLLNGGASTTQMSILGPLIIGTSTASTTIWGNTATSTFASGINLTNGGCFAIGSTCLTAGALGGGSTEAVNWATTAILAGTPTYSNGVSGVGATLTEVGNGALSIDSNAPAAGDRVLIKNQASAFQNGIYTVTQTGSGIAVYILTRATDYNTPTEITPGITTYVLSGTVNTDSTWAVSYTPPLVIGTNNLTYSEAAGTNGTVTSVALSVPSVLSISGSPITTSGTLALTYSGTALPVANGGTGQTTFTASQLFYGNGTNAVSTVATSSFAVNALLTYTGTLGAFVGGTGGTLNFANAAANTVFGNATGASAVPTFFATSSLFTFSPGFSQTAASVAQIEHHSFTYSTSTAWTGTTTIPLEVGYGETWNSIQCYTDIGTLNTQVGYGTASTTMLNASTTIGTVTYTTNNLMTAGNKVKVDVGTPATAPTKITCTEKDTN